MSHGTGSYYVVVSPEERRRRAVEEQRRRCAGLDAQIAGVVAEAVALGARAGTGAKAPRGDDLDAWTAHADTLTAELAAARGSAREAQRAAVAVAIDEHLTRVSQGISLDLRAVASHGRRAGPADDGLRSSLESAAALIAGIADEPARTRLLGIAEDALTLVTDDANAARGRLAILRNEVHRELADQAQREKLRASVDELLLDAAGLPPAATAGIANLAASVQTVGDLVAVRARIDDERQRAAAEDDRRVAVREVTAALGRMGYDVGEEFADALATGRTLVEPPDLPGYGIELHLQGDRRRLLTETIALTEDTSADLAAQAAACSAVDRLGVELAAGGVRLDRYSTATPGQLPMQRDLRQDAQEQQPDRRRRRTTQRQERHL